MQTGLTMQLILSEITLQSGASRRFGLVAALGGKFFSSLWGKGVGIGMTDVTYTGLSNALDLKTLPIKHMPHVETSLASALVRT